ncbi:MAG: CARDB domain-containing protein [archaeon]
MVKKELMIFGVLIIFSLLIVGFVYALDFERQYRLNFGHIVFIKSVDIIDSDQENLKELKLEIENTGNFSILDLRTEIYLPNNIYFYEDISRRKVARLPSGESRIFTYNIIYDPSVEEGIYNAEILIDYVNHIGDEREDNDTFGIIVQRVPKFFVEVENSEIYQGNNIGDVTIRFINYGLADIKFLTVELGESSDYRTISNSRQYVGDLDSDDFESLDFRLKVINTKKDVELPLKISYKDSLNNDYEKEIILDLEMYTAKELGISNGGVAGYFILIVIVLIIAWFVYRKFKKKRKFRR